MNAAQVARAKRRATARAETKLPAYANAARLAIRDLLVTAARRFEERVVVHLTAAIIDALEGAALEVAEVAERHRPDGGYGSTAWNAGTRTVFWVCADWTSNEEWDAAEADFMAIAGVENFESEAETGLPEGDDWIVVFTEALAAAGEPPGWTPPADDEMLTLDEIIARYRSKTDPVRQAAVGDFFAAFGKEAKRNGVRANWDTTNPVVAAHIDRTGSQVTDVAETTRQNVRGIVARSYSEGLSVRDTAAAMRDYAVTISDARSTLIARTEFAGLVQGGSLAATQIVSDATGNAYLKVWRTAPGAEYPRHEEYEGLDGQTVTLDGLFEVGGDQLSYPGDPEGDPAEVCNCRCDLEYVERGENEEGAAPVEEPAVSQTELGAMTNASVDELAAVANSQALALEPAVTPALAQVARSVHGDMAGLKFKFKTKGSLGRKIAADAEEKQITHAQSAGQIVDALRYTFRLSTDDYATGYRDAKAALEARGFRFVKEKNYWEGDVYKGMNAVLETRGGYRFELQFHTPASLAAKEPGHLLYDEYRQLDPNSARARELQAEMTALWSKVEPPPGASALGQPR